MPTLNFVLPHWMYWGGLLLFPLLAMYLVAKHRREGAPREPILFNAYLFWLTAGFAGLHRFYLRSLWGFLFVPFFIGIIYCNSQVREVRDDVSRTFAALEQAKNAVKQAAPIDAANPTAEERDALAKAQAEVAKDSGEYEAAAGVSEGWVSGARWLAVALAALMIVDAFLIPGVVRRAHARGDSGPRGADLVLPPDAHAQGTEEDPTRGMHSRFTDVIERVNVKAGEFVAYWAVISVFVYYYEVIARFLFNSPTNWVHESMFLMFGMQYMISGAYAYFEDQHVRVDVVYSHLSPRGKAIADIISSIFFFIFAITMFVTGWRFALDAIHNTEISFTEWAVQYWPVKLCIPIGAALIVLQGICKLMKDIMIVRGKRA
jgi:TRAP-type mannitol/chloroaromatic compound transport system permease small subunit